MMSASSVALVRGVSFFPCFPSPSEICIFDLMKPEPIIITMKSSAHVLNKKVIIIPADEQMQPEKRQYCLHSVPLN